MTKLEKQLPDGKGFIHVVDTLGSDVTVVNAARVSFGKNITTIRDSDIKLLAYLAQHKHTSPFRHIYVQLHVKAPEFVARQWYKHIVGSDYSFKDQPWNEISGRYVEYELESFIPAELRAQATDRKQGSSSEVVAQNESLLADFKQHVDNTFSLYNKLIEAGVAKEQARMVLPLTFYTEWYWTASLQAIAHFVGLRNKPTAQLEIQDYAVVLDECMTELFPNAWKALNDSNK